MRLKSLWVSVNTLIIVGSLAPSVLWATNYYVDPIHGSNLNTGTKCDPWKTLQQVFENGVSFQSGDHIYLLRGDHGAPIVTGLNTQTVTIEPLEGHTPVLQSLRVSSASHWDIKGLFISPKAAPNMQRIPVPYLVDVSPDSHHIILEDSYVFSDFQVDSWTQDDWMTKAYPGVRISGSNNTIQGNHIYNTVTGLLMDTQSENNLIDNNVIENFGHDGMDETGAVNTFQYNLIMNHFNMGDDVVANGFQAYGSDNLHGSVITGNTILGSFKHPNLALYDGTMHGIGLLGPAYVDYQIENNIVMSDNRISLWLLGGRDCKIVNNTIFPTNDHAHTGGGPSGIRLYWRDAVGNTSPDGIDNVVENNIAGEFGLLNPDGSSVCTTAANCSHNLVNTSSSYFLSPLARDLRPKNIAKIINKGEPVHAPLLDAAKVARNGRIDLGAYQYLSGLTADQTPPSIPQGLTAIFVPGLGVDLSWTASTDNRKVAGYDIYRNHTKIARIRAGTHFLDPILDITGVTYGVKAFDFSMNFSDESSSIAAN